MKLATTRINKNIMFVGSCTEKEYRNLYEAFKAIEHMAKIYRAESCVCLVNLPTCIITKIEFKTNRQCGKFEQAMPRT